MPKTKYGLVPGQLFMLDSKISLETIGLRIYTSTLGHVYTCSSIVRSLVLGTCSGPTSGTHKYSTVVTYRPTAFYGHTDGYAREEKL